MGKILVVDDEEPIRSLLVEHFQREGFVVLEAADGEEALQAVRRTRPDLVVLDVGLPGMDGIQVLRRIRREDPGIGHWAAINVSRIADATLVVAQGSLDTVDAERMKRVLDNLLEDGRVKLVVDLVGVTSIDSSGVGAIVGAMKRARAVGGTLRLCGLQGDVRSVFETSGLTARLEVHVSREEAISQESVAGSRVRTVVDTPRAGFMATTPSRLNARCSVAVKPRSPKRRDHLVGQDA